MISPEINAFDTNKKSNDDGQSLEQVHSVQLQVVDQNDLNLDSQIIVNDITKEPTVELNTSKKRMDDS